MCLEHLHNRTPFASPFTILARSCVQLTNHEHTSLHRHRHISLVQTLHLRLLFFFRDTAENMTTQLTTSTQLKFRKGLWGFIRVRGGLVQFLPPPLPPPLLKPFSPLIPPPPPPPLSFKPQSQPFPFNPPSPPVPHPFSPKGGGPTVSRFFKFQGHDPTHCAGLGCMSSSPILPFEFTTGRLKCGT